MYYQVISYLIYHFKAARKLIAIIPKNKSSQKLGLWIHTVFHFRVILRNWLILFSYKLKEDGWSQRCVGNCCICTLLSKIARNAGGSSVTYRSSPLVFFSVLALIGMSVLWAGYGYVVEYFLVSELFLVWQAEINIILSMQLIIIANSSQETSRLLVHGQL